MEKECAYFTTGPLTYRLSFGPCYPIIADYIRIRYEVQVRWLRLRAAHV